MDRPLLAPAVVECLERRLLFALYGPDPGFANGGHADAPASQLLEVRQDGKIFAVGFRVIPPEFFDDQPDFVTTFTRLNADGTPDTSFAPGGKLEPNVGRLETFDAARLYFFADGGLLAYNRSGQIDTTFGGGTGVNLASLARPIPDMNPNDPPEVRSVDAAPDGGVLVRLDIHVGNTDSTRALVPQVIKLKPDGALDTAFGDGGAILFPTGSARWDHIRELGLLVTSNGFLLMQGARNVARYEFDGTPDTSFGSNGTRALGFMPEQIAEQPDGKLLFVTEIESGAAQGTRQRRLVRFNANGTPDTAFGTSGSVAIPVNRTGGNEIGEIEFDAQNRILLPLGAATAAFNVSPLTLYRFSAAGVLDAAPFDGTLLGEDAAAFQIEFDAQGRIITGSGEQVTRLDTLDPVEVGRNGGLYIHGDDANDAVTIATSGDQISVTRNGTTTSYAAADITGLTLRLNGGNNTVASSINLPTVVRTRGGNDSVTTAGSNDTINTDAGADNINSGAGNDNLTTAAGAKTIDIGAGNDVVRLFNFPGGEADHNVITGGDGNKDIEANRGRLTITLGTGDSRIETSPNNVANHITIAGGSNTIEMGGANDFLSIGGSGDNKVTVGGTGGADVTTGSGRDDIAVYTSGTVRSGGGNDTLDIRANFDEKLLLVFAGDGNDTLTTDESSTYDYVTVAHGENGNDALAGSHGGQTLYGGAGKDTLRGGYGSDLLTGGGGHDHLIGDQGKDRLYGGAGADRIAGGSGDDRIVGHAGRDNLRGDTGNDLVWGGAGNDALYANHGNDALYGEGGHDRLYGDYLFGIGTLSGGAGNDLLVSRDDNLDHLFGDDGDDTGIADEADALDGVETS